MCSHCVGQKLQINLYFQIEVSKSGCLDFGDLPGGSAKSLALRLLNRTHATVPIRLVISAVSLLGVSGLDRKNCTYY